MSSVQSAEASEVAKIQALKRRLVKDDDFGAVMDQFFTWFGGDPSFFDKSIAAEDRRLAQAILVFATQVFGIESPFAEIGLSAVPEHRMKHGTVTLRGWRGAFFYFEDLGLGLVGLAPEDLKGKTCYVRFAHVTRLDPTTN